MCDVCVCVMCVRVRLAGTFFWTFFQCTIFIYGLILLRLTLVFALMLYRWHKLKVGQLPPQFPMTVRPDVTAADAVSILQKEGFDQMPVVNEAGDILGMVTEGNLSSFLLRGKVKKTDPVSKVLYKQFATVDTEMTLESVSRILDNEPFALVTSTTRCCKLWRDHPFPVSATASLCSGVAVTWHCSRCCSHVLLWYSAVSSPTQVETKKSIFSILTRIDLLDFIMKGDASGAHA